MTQFHAPTIRGFHHPTTEPRLLAPIFHQTQYSTILVANDIKRNHSTKFASSIKVIRVNSVLCLVSRPIGQSVNYINTVREADRNNLQGSPSRVTTRLPRPQPPLFGTCTQLTGKPWPHTAQRQASLHSAHPNPCFGLGTHDITYDLSRPHCHTRLATDNARWRRCVRVHQS